MSQRSHYEVLGVPPTASTDDIKKKYREMARKFHPDRAKDKETAQKVFAQINVAYSVLSDPDKRTHYDATLAGERAGGTNGTGAAAGRGTPPPPTGPLTAEQMAHIARWISDAENHLMQNKLDNAKAVCQLILKTDPRNTKALGMLGEALERMGKPQEAAAAYRQALQIAPSALLQAKLNRLQGSAPGSGPGQAGLGQAGLGQAGPSRQAPPSPPPNGTPPPTAGAGSNGTARPTPRPAQKPAEKPAGGLLGRLLGKK